jgi:hypothetical protein
MILHAICAIRHIIAYIASTTMSRSLRRYPHNSLCKSREFYIHIVLSSLYPALKAGATLMKKRGVGRSLRWPPLKQVEGRKQIG